MATRGRQSRLVAAVAVLLLVPRAIPAEPPVPPAPGREGRTREPLDRAALDLRVSDLLRAAYAKGAEQLYNRGSRTEAVYLFEGALEAVVPLLDHHDGLARTVLQRIASARTSETVGARARELRELFILVLEQVERPPEPTPGPPATITVPPRPVATMWTRLGGDARARRIVLDFFRDCLRDRTLDFTRGGRLFPGPDEFDLATDWGVDWLAEASGGPSLFRDRPNAVRALGVTHDEFDRAKVHFRNVLNRHGVSGPDAARLMSYLERLRRNVVERPPDAAPVRTPPASSGPSQVSVGPTLKFDRNWNESLVSSEPLLSVPVLFAAATLLILCVIGAMSIFKVMTAPMRPRRLPGGVDGVLITAVAAGSPAESAGLRVTHRIYTVNGARVASIEDVQSEVAGRRRVVIEVIGDEGAIESVLLRPANGRLGIDGEPAWPHERAGGPAAGA